MTSNNRGDKQIVSVSRSVVRVVAMLVAALFVTLPVNAASSGGTSVQGYSAETPLDNGTIVQLVAKDSNTVKIATQKELQNMFGVTVDRAQLPFIVSNEGLKNETYVAVSGTYNVLVSTQGGAIKSGDFVTLSSISGIAMKAGTEEKTVFGRAAAGFDGKGVNLGKTTLKDSTGKDNREIMIGSIPVSINIQRNPNDKSTKANVPEVLERVGKAIAEKEVSPIRIYISMGIVAVSMIAAIVMLYSGIRSAVISIGRNPMGKKSIFRALLEVILTAILILIVGLFAVYLLLKL